MTFDWARGRHPELLSGAFYRPLDTAVPHQFFATSMLLSPVLSGLLGWDPDAARAEARLAPQLPPSWERVTVRHLRVGPSDLTAIIERAAGRATVTLSATAPVALHFVQGLPAGAREPQALLDGKPVSAGPQRGVHDETFEVRVEVGARPRKLEFTWTGGLEVDPPRTALTPGQPSTGPRVLDFRPTDAGWTLMVEGTAARRYDLRLVGEPPSRVDGAEVAARDGQVTTLAVTFPPGTARQVRTITLSR
jgi:hypothetical protein